MIRQTILPFKKVNRCLPSPGSRAGFKASAYVFPLVLMFNGGGRSLKDLWVIRDDVGLGEILPLSIVPSADAVGDWLRRAGVNGGLEGLEQANRSLLKRALKARWDKAVYVRHRCYRHFCREFVSLIFNWGFGAQLA